MVQVLNFLNCKKVGHKYSAIGCSSSIFLLFVENEANQDEAVAELDNGALTRGNFQTGRNLGPPDQQWRESGILVPSKLPMTSGIILIVLLIFMASLGLTLFLLVMLAKRRRQIQEVIMTSTKDGPREPSGEKDPSFPTPHSGSQHQVGSSTIEKCCSTIFLNSTRPLGNGSSSLMEHPLYTMIGKDLSAGAKGKDGESSEVASCFDLSSSDTTFTIISNQNDFFPPPPTSIISTASTSHGYGSIEEDEDADEVEVERFYD